MPPPGYVFKDGGPIPDSELANKPSTAKGTEREEVSRAMPYEHQPRVAPNSSAVRVAKADVHEADPPTDSHALAEADHEEKGAAQEGHFEHEVKDLGWNEQPGDVPNPMIGGLPNEELWLLVRRFNKQMYHVKAIPEPPLGGLDLNIADEEEFSPDKLRANLERLYMTVIVGVIGFGKHIARLRSWREPRRTAAFATAYLIAWIFNFIMPLMFTTMIVLIAYPPSRAYMFPPAPLALVNSKTGGIQSPKAGVLGSHDSVTGAPEKHRGEAVEQEASNFVSGIATVALTSASGKHEPAEPDTDPIDSNVPDPSNVAMASVNAKSSTSGGMPSAKHDKTKVPMEEAMWDKVRPTMHIVANIADGWERFANALSPTPPFPQERPRLILAALLIPAVAMSLFVTPAMVIKGTYFGTGFGFFGDPVIWRAASWLNRTFPNWQKLLEIRNTLLKGVPTNAQLTITLLRIGERNRAPLPPPPRSDAPPSDKPKALDKDELVDSGLDASHEEIHDAIHADPTVETAADAETASQKPKHKHGSGLLRFLKGTTKGAVEGKLSVDTVRAKVGSTHAKNHLGILPNKQDQVQTGPVDFKARYKGSKGRIYINTSATIPCVAFSKHPSDGTYDEDLNELKPVFSVPIEEISELKKVGGLGWKAKLVVGWATDRQVADGIEIVTKTGENYTLRAITLREELFNRLVAMGGQKWESW